MSGLFVTLAVATAHHRAGSSTLSVSINYVAIMPIIIMVGGAVLLLAVASLIGKPLRMTAATGGTIVIALTALGFAIAWPMDSSQAFHGIVNLFLIPLWLLSGALFPLAGASGWIRALMYINPLTYGVEALRLLLYPGVAGPFELPSAMATLLLFSLVMFALAFLMANRRSTRPAA